MENDNKFHFGLPVDIIKGKNSKGEERLMFKGKASTSNKDSQGESLDVNGFDLSEFRTVNWNHGKTPDLQIGEPTKAIVKGGELNIEGELYSEMPQAVATHTLMKALKKRGKSLYLSVEGKVTQRGSNDKNHPAYNKILKSKITGVAITKNPINSDTFCELIEKGYTENNEWSFDDETEALAKAAETGELEDDDTEKAMTAEGAQGVTAKESVETAGDKKPIKNLEETQTKVFKKSDIFESIYDRSPEITIEKAKSVYSLIEKVANMSTEKKEITGETISKAFEILDLASSEISKGEKDGKESKKEEEKEEEDDKEMVEKAKGIYKSMSVDGKDTDSIKASLIKKGYNENVITKAMKEDSSKTEPTGISKAEINDLIKSQIGNIGEKFEAVTTILKAQIESNEDLKKSLETISLENESLKTSLAKISKESPGRKSVQITKSYSEKFEKSEDGQAAGQKFNLLDKTDRQNLKLQIIEKSGMNQSENFNKDLARIAQEMELTHTISKASDIQILRGHGFELVAE